MSRGIGPIRRFDVLPSTNDEALRLADAGAPAGTAVVADSQTAGRGRAGHSWSSPPGVALYASLLLRPTLPPETVPLVTMACGVGLADAVRSATGLPARLKWPNDVLVNGRKCAGILCERSDGAVVCGFGLNVNTPPERLPERPIFPATSLAAEAGGGRRFDREALLSVALERIGAEVAALEAPSGAAALADTFSALDALRGRRVRVDEGAGGGTTEGVDVGVAASGALLLRLPDGSIREIWAGSVSLSGA